MSLRRAFAEIIGYTAEVSLPNDRPMIAYYTDRYLFPRLSALEEYVENKVIPDERDRLREQVAALGTLLHDDPSSRSGALVEWVRRDVVLELLGGEDDEQ